MAFSKEIEANVAFLEQRARDAAQQETERSSALDQKTAGLIAAALVLLAAGVAFIGNLDGLHAGQGAKTLWVVLIVLALALLLASLIVGVFAIWPQAYRVVIAVSELDRWPTEAFLDRDPTLVQGEQMRASLAAATNARPINRKKADRLTVAFSFFGTAILCIVALSTAVAIRVASGHHEQHRKTHSYGRPPHYYHHHRHKHPGRD